MRHTFITLIASLLVLHSLRVQSEEAAVKIFNHWPRGFYGRVAINLEEDVEDGWQVTLTFSKTVQNVTAWNAEVDTVSDDQTVYVLKNKFWNAQLEAGSELKFRFLGRKGEYGESEPSVSAEFARLEEGSGF